MPEKKYLCDKNTNYVVYNILQSNQESTCDLGYHRSSWADGRGTKYGMKLVFLSQALLRHHLVDT